VALNGGISVMLALLYFCAQMIGGVIGAAFTRVGKTVNDRFNQLDQIILVCY
jgi:glycerol uptake facilitator-like aquaporin